MSLQNIDRIKRESKAERARKEQVRREATLAERAKRRAQSNGSLTDEEAMDAFIDANVSERKPDGLVRRLAANDLPAKARERLNGQANPVPVSIPQRQDVVEEIAPTHVSVGRNKAKEEKQIKAVTLAERLHKDGIIDDDQLAAAGRLRNKYMLEMGHSEGVSSYGDSRSDGMPWAKADKRAEAILSRNRSNLRELAELLFSMAGNHDEEDNKIFDRELATFVVRSVIETTDAIALRTEVGRTRTGYSGEKQLSAAGGAILGECYHRGAAHIRRVKSEQWRANSWRVVEATAAAK